MRQDLIDMALPLVHGLRGDLTLEEWRAFCRPILSGARDDVGMECVLDEKGYLMGLAGYDARPDLRHGRVLQVDPFIAADLYGRSLAAQMLLARLDRLAVRHGCAAVHVAYEAVDDTLPIKAGHTFKKFFESGYRADSVRLCRNLPPMD